MKKKMGTFNNVHLLCKYIELHNNHLLHSTQGIVSRNESYDDNNYRKNATRALNSTAVVVVKVVNMSTTITITTTTKVPATSNN